MSEGSFYIKRSGELFFSLRQRSDKLLFESFRLVFNSKTAIEDREGYMKFSVSSVKNLTDVVKFFSFSGLHPLMGLKLVSYNQWIGTMKRLPRFKNVKLP